MNQVVQSQHPAVVLRSNYNHLRTLLAVAMIAVVGLSAAVVILATDEDGVTTPTARSVDVASAPSLPAGTRYDGGPDEGTRGLSTSAPAPSPGIRYDGGPEEGTRGLSVTAATSPGIRYDGGPEEGTRGIGAQDGNSSARTSRPEPAFR